jgi:hypothetical protein
VAALRATALGQGRRRRRLHLRVLRHRDCRAPQDVDAGARRVAGDDQTGRARRQDFTCRRCTARSGWRSWRDIAAAWEPSARNRDRLPPSRPSRTPNWGDLGRGRRSA